MKSIRYSFPSSTTNRTGLPMKLRSAVVIAALATSLLLPSMAWAQKAFATPEAAGNAFIDAVATNDEAALQGTARSRTSGASFRNASTTQPGPRSSTPRPRAARL